MRVYDGDGGTSNARSVQIKVTARIDGTPSPTARERVNTPRPEHVGTGPRRTLADGSLRGRLAVNSGQDGSGWGIYAQRFASNGEPSGPSCGSTPLPAATQSWARVAPLSTFGGYVITWRDDGASDGSSYGVYGQRFDAAGSALGGSS